MDISIKKYGKIVKLTLQGSLDSSTSEDFIEYTKNQLDLGFNKFIIDCSFLIYISSNGISSLIKLNEIFSHASAIFILVQLNEESLSLLRLFGLDKRFRIRNSILEAESDLNLFQDTVQKSNREFSKIRMVDKSQGPTSFYDYKESPRQYEHQEVSDQMETLKTMPLERTPPPRKKPSFTNHYGPIQDDYEEEQELEHIILCSFCDSKVKVSKSGKYRCPHCYKIFFHKN